MEAGDTFTLYPLDMASDTKLISTSLNSKSLQAEIDALNTTHRALQTLSNNPVGVPPPPQVVDPKRSAAIAKLRETGNEHFKKSRYAEAVKVYSLALQAALDRPSWEPNGLVKEEVSTLYGNRAQAHMGLLDWASAAVDAESSAAMKPVGNAKAWWRRGKCLLEMGRLEEANEWVGQALERESEEADLKALQKEILEKLSADKQ